ncbi:MAG: glutamine-hydrolyzing carbamoyl-phosphate synthase small subunit [bacterium]|nr:glutamine-hydrolyzing carbamoyl-phosphate synthase small subunit [bacterium]
MKKGILVLESGICFEGTLFGSNNDAIGEIVFNTAMTGYEEVLTDPSYKGQIVVMTYPHIGNYGITLYDFESKTPKVNGFVAREFSKIFSNYRAKMNIEALLKKYNITAIENIDTRALTKYIRDNGNMMAIITSKNKQKALEILKKSTPTYKLDLVRYVTTKEPIKFNNNKNRKNIVVIDGGCKLNIVRILAKHLNVTILPPDVKPNKIIEYKPIGVVISNGPGDPEKATYLINTVEKLIAKLPLLGICLGHQIIALAVGSKTYKLKFGHHGVNHPVKNIFSGKIDITSQNHNYSVEADTTENVMHIKNAKDFIVTHINLNDLSIEGYKHKTLPIFAYQFHPESSPGPYDANYLIEEFINICLKEKI